MTQRYRGDFYAWTQEQGALLRTGRVQELDLQSIAEEIEGMGDCERRVLVGRLEQLLAHLLRWRFQPERRSRSGQGSILYQCEGIAALLEESPSLSARLDETLNVTYQKAVRLASLEAGMVAQNLPPDCPWDLGEILDPHFVAD